MAVINDIKEKYKNKIEKYVNKYREMQECYRDDFEMQLCIEEDLACDEVYDITEQEILAKHIIDLI